MVVVIPPPICAAILGLLTLSLVRAAIRTMGGARIFTLVALCHNALALTQAPAGLAFARSALLCTDWALDFSRQQVHARRRAG